ncbi:MAG TPA: radical SAM protein, partial [Desulfobaccales bacterium]
MEGHRPEGQIFRNHEVRRVEIQLSQMSLYVQITKRCNMTCNHCAFSCGAQGPDMSAETFRRVLDLAALEEAPITIGGGEPTLHPGFMDFLWWTIRR